MLSFGSVEVVCSAEDVVDSVFTLGSAVGVLLSVGVASGAVGVVCSVPDVVKSSFFIAVTINCSFSRLLIGCKPLFTLHTLVLPTAPSMFFHAFIIPYFRRTFKTKTYDNKSCHIFLFLSESNSPSCSLCFVSKP